MAGRGRDRVCWESLGGAVWGTGWLSSSIRQRMLFTQCWSPNSTNRTTMLHFKWFALASVWLVGNGDWECKLFLLNKVARRPFRTTIQSILEATWLEKKAERLLLFLHVESISTSSWTSANSTAFFNFSSIFLSIVFSLNWLILRKQSD